MLKLIHADLYRVFHRFYFYTMMAALSGLCILLVTVMKSNSFGTVSVAWKFFLSILIYPVFLLPMLTGISAGEENRNHTLKNTVSFGVSRPVLYLSKTVSTILLGVVLMAVVLGVYCGFSFLTMTKDAAFSGGFIQDFAARVASVCLVYMAAIAISIFFTAIFRRNSLSIFLFYGVFFFTDSLFKLLHLADLNIFLLKTQIFRIESVPVVQLFQPVLISLGTLAVFTVLGVAWFRRSDIS
ncbi:MAG: hypothetical protein LKJ45_06430 [Oscillospiraceae bacterium]|jgi:hypothetical protein|nr:hypothetical protein [Oscillospiraceae bacterium]